MLSTAFVETNAMPFSAPLAGLLKDLFYGETLLLSVMGVQQGDPLGPALFSLGVDRASRLPTSEFNTGYLEDATLGGTIEKLLFDLPNLISELHQSELAINDAKCELILHNHSQEEKRRTLNRFRELLLNTRLLKEKERISVA